MANLSFLSSSVCVLTFALSFFGCGSSNDDTSPAMDSGATVLPANGDAASTASTAPLDGAWKITLATGGVFGTSYTGGSISAGDGMYKLTFNKVIGQSAGTNCAVAQDDVVVSVDLLAMMTGASIVEETTNAGAGCASTATTTRPVYDVTVAETTASTPTATPYDGTWTVNLGKSGATVKTFTVSVDGLSWTTSTSVSGSVGSGTATAMGPSAAQFAATRQ